MNNAEIFASLHKRLRETQKVATSVDYMFEDTDFDSATGKRIHNLTITWAQPEEHETENDE